MIAMAVGGGLRRGVAFLKLQEVDLTRRKARRQWVAGGAADRARRAGSTAAPPKPEFKLPWGVFGAKKNE